MFIQFNKVNISINTAAPYINVPAMFSLIFGKCSVFIFGDRKIIIQCDECRRLYQYLHPLNKCLMIS